MDQQTADLKLVLAVDTSGSVDARRFELQKQGYVAAFRNRRVLDAILSGGNRAIAVTMTQWTGPSLQAQVVPWTLLRDPATVNAFAAAIEDTPRQLFFGGTSISGAIDHAMLLLPNAPRPPCRRSTPSAQISAARRPVASGRERSASRGRRGPTHVTRLACAPCE